MAHRPIAIAGNDRVFLTGKTGSGKTWLAMSLLLAVPRLVVVDLKGTLDQWELTDEGPEVYRELLNGNEARARCRSVESGIKYMEAALVAGGCIVYIDEVYAFVGQGQRPPDILTAIWTRGRELGVGGWAASQRPTWVPLWLQSEADWVFMFRLRLDEDRQRMKAFMGEEVLKPITDEHGFFVTKADWDSADYYAGLTSGAKISASLAEG